MNITEIIKETPVVIWAGGLGTRMGAATQKLPKPLVKIGGRPILEHIMHIYADQGARDFIILTGYKRDLMAKWQDDYRDDFRRMGWVVCDVITGLDTQTGGRLMRAANVIKFLTKRLFIDRPMFFATYGDGLADVNLRALVEHHLSHNLESPAVTLTAVNPPDRFGRLNLVGGYCDIFTEKGSNPDGWINGGFYLCDLDIIDLIPSKSTVFEKDILPTLAAQNRLAALRHYGQFRCMDTQREWQELDRLAKDAVPYWRRFHA